MQPRANLFIIGAMKSGTTSLHEYLGQHPDIFMSQMKEPGYFVEELNLHQGPNWYHDLFKGAGDARWIGESSTHYSKLPLYKGVAERIHRYNPEARLVYIMREPFERLVSHYWHDTRAFHRGGEPWPIQEAVRRKSDYLAFSDYPRQIEEYLRFFPREQLYLLTFEELTRDPEPTVNRLLEWLGVDTGAGIDWSAAHNARPEQLTGVAGRGVLNRIRYSKTWGRLSPLLPKPLKQRATALAYRPVDPSAQKYAIEQLQRETRARLCNEIDELEKMTGRKYPEWK